MGWYSKFKIESPSEHVNNHASLLINRLGKVSIFKLFNCCINYTNIVVQVKYMNDIYFK